jgi:hypothetical protein
MSKAPEDKVFKEIYESDPPVVKYEKENSSCVYRFRIVEAQTDPKIRIDIREFLRSNAYVGWTSRGLSMSSEQVGAFIEKLTDLKKKLEEINSKPKAKKASKK